VRRRIFVSPYYCVANIDFYGVGRVYALLVLVDASSVMSTATSAANAGVGVDTGASITARTAASPTATAIFEFIDY
jgi:hypothetical protein